MMANDHHPPHEQDVVALGAALLQSKLEMQELPQSVAAGLLKSPKDALQMSATSPCDRAFLEFGVPVSFPAKRHVL